MKQEEEPITGLPENAFRELKPGEVYNPLMSPDKPQLSKFYLATKIMLSLLNRSIVD